MFELSLLLPILFISVQEKKLKLLRHVFLILKVKDSTSICLNFNSNGKLSIQLPQGSSSDSYKIYLLVNIVDDSYGSTLYDIQTPIIVTPVDGGLINSLNLLTLSNATANNSILVGLNSGNLNLVSKNVIALSSDLNKLSNSQNLSSIETNQISLVREFMVTKVNSLSLSDISSMKIISSSLSVATQFPAQISSKIAVIFLIKFVSTLC